MRWAFPLSEKTLCTAPPTAGVLVVKAAGEVVKAVAVARAAATQRNFMVMYLFKTKRADTMWDEGFSSPHRPSEASLLGSGYGRVRTNRKMADARWKMERICFVRRLIVRVVQDLRTLSLLLHVRVENASLGSSMVELFYSESLCSLRMY